MPLSSKQKLVLVVVDGNVVVVVDGVPVVVCVVGG
jgi:hypothetical protein